MSSIKGIIFDYGGTIDTDGIHWGELIWQEYVAAGVQVEKETYRDAYVHGERTLAKRPIILPTDLSLFGLLFTVYKLCKLVCEDLLCLVKL